MIFSASALLRLRRDALLSELATLDAKLQAIETDYEWPPTVWCIDRVQRVIDSAPDLVFTTAELADATFCSEPAVRRSLTKLVAEKRVTRERRGGYRSVRIAAGVVEPIKLASGVSDPPLLTAEDLAQAQRDSEQLHEAFKRTKAMESVGDGGQR